MTPLRNLLTCMLLAALAACGGGDAGQIPASPRVEMPANPDDQWTLVAPASVGMDAATLAQAPASIDANSGVSAMLVMRHGQPVMEQYWNGYGKDSLHDTRSATKSITSLLVGMAIDEHDLGGVDDTLAQWLSADYPGAPVLSRGLTLENLLTMQSGLACNDWDIASPGNESNIWAAQDWVQFYLNLPSLHPAGDGVAVYCTGNPIALGHVLKNATHQGVDVFAQSHLFGPLGITSARWHKYDNDTQVDTGCCIQMRPRDMARIGQFALQRGMWNGTQLVSSAWIDISTAQHTAFDSSPADGYGYLWWHSTDQYGLAAVDTFYANGAGGQFIFVTPALDLVAVFTGENYGNQPAIDRAHRLYGAYIMAAVKAGS